MRKIEQLLSNEELTKIIESSRELMGIPKELITKGDWLSKALGIYVSDMRERLYSTITYGSPTPITISKPIGYSNYTTINPIESYISKPDIIQQPDGSWEDSNGNKLFMINKSKTNGK